MFIKFKLNKPYKHIIRGENKMKKINCKNGKDFCIYGVAK